MAEEMIINDVDVTECKYYNKCSRDCEDNNVYDCVLCANIPNCHYKQLKRAVQKLEKIKDIATDLLSLTNEYDNCYHKDKCSKCNKECQYRFVDKILQIIEDKTKERKCT